MAKTLGKANFRWAVALFPLRSRTGRGFTDSRRESRAFTLAFLRPHFNTPAAPTNRSGSAIIRCRFRRRSPTAQRGPFGPPLTPTRARGVQRCNDRSCGSARCAVLVLSSRGFGEDYRPPKEVKVLPVFFVAKGESPPTEQQDGQPSEARDLGANAVQADAQGPRHVRAGRGQAAGLPRRTRRRLLSRAVGGGGAADRRRVAATLQVQPLQLPFDIRGGRDESARRLSGRRRTPVQRRHQYAAAASWKCRRTGWTEPRISSRRCNTSWAMLSGCPTSTCTATTWRRIRRSCRTTRRITRDGFKPSKTPGILIAEDIRALALNRRVFPRLRFDPKTDVPQGYTMQKIVTLGPMDIPGHPIIRSATPPDAYFTRHFITTLQTSAEPSGRSVARPGA